jgi:hypothetical protein
MFFFVAALLKKKPKNGKETGGANLRASLAPSTGRPKWPAAMADLPDELLRMLVKLVVKGEPDSAGLLSLSDASKGMRAAMHRVIPDVLRVSLPQTVSTEKLVRWMCEDSALAAEVLAMPRQREASVAILSRLVDLSKLARREKVSEKERAIARKLIDTARPDLLESLRNATVGQQQMYPKPDALAREVIEKLKGRGYEKIMNAQGELSDRSSLFLRDERGDRDERART